MKVQELIDNKKHIESAIYSVKEAIKTIEKSKKNCQDILSVRIFDGSGNYSGVSVPHCEMEEILNKRIEKFELEIEPINKKLEAIELMLNS